MQEIKPEDDSFSSVSYVSLLNISPKNYKIIEKVPINNFSAERIQILCICWFTVIKVCSFQQNYSSKMQVVNKSCNFFIDNQ